MKKIKLFAGLFAILLLSSVLFSACGDTPLVVKNISVVQNGYQTLYYADEDYQNDITILIKYTNGTTEKQSVKKSMTNFEIKSESDWAEDEHAIFSQQVIINYKNRETSVKLGFVFSEFLTSVEILSDYKIFYNIDEQFDISPIKFVNFRLDANDSNYRYERKPVLISGYEYVIEDAVYTSVDTAGVYSFGLRYADTGGFTGVSLKLIVGNILSRYEFEGYESVLDDAAPEKIAFILTKLGINPKGTDAEILAGIQQAYQYLSPEQLESAPAMPNSAEDLEEFFQILVEVINMYSYYLDDIRYMPNQCIFIDNDVDFLMIWYYDDLFTSAYDVSAIVGLIYGDGVNERQISSDGETLTITYLDSMWGAMLTITYKLAQ